MRKLLLCLWLTVPVGAGAYHLGPGQDHVRADEAARLLSEAQAHVARATELAASEGDLAATGDWAAAEAAYTEVLDLLPRDAVHERRSVTLERAKARMFISQLPEASRDLQALVDELLADGAADPALLADARRTHANSQYYMTWLMRLEGRSRQDWEPVIEAARQSYRLLAEQSGAGDDGEAHARDLQDLESAVLLARMDLTELQGLPLPSQ
jgi:hypothetical protein